MKYSYIDSIRGIAILMVILVHTFNVLDLEPGVLSTLSVYGQMGVQLFFVASAFTLCLSYSRRKDEHSPVLSFYIRRLFRIAPMYYLGIAGYCILRTLINYVNSGEILIPDQYTPINIMANALFFHGIYEPANNNIVPGGWSIGTEVLFYLIFPLLMLLLYKRLQGKLDLIISFPIVVLVILVLVINGFTDISVENNSFIYYSIFLQLPVFAIGIALFFLLDSYESLLLRMSVPFIAISFVIFSLLSIYVGWVAQIENAFIFVPFLSAVSFFFLVELFRRVDKLNLNILIKVGQRSYSMYLIHFFFAYHVTGILNKHILSHYFSIEITLVLTYLFSACASYVIAGYTYKYIEVYFIKLGSSLIKRISSNYELQLEQRK